MSYRSSIYREIVAYKGKYTPKNKSKYEGDPTNIIYRSMWERHCFRWCDENPKVKKWSSEEVVIPYLYEVDRRYHRYYMDLKIVFENKTVLVEIKPDKETRPPTGSRRTKKYISEGYTYVKNMNKWKPTSTRKITVGSFRSGQRRPNP